MTNKRHLSQRERETQELWDKLGVPLEERGTRRVRTTYPNTPPLFYDKTYKGGKLVSSTFVQ
jgi:hypothetical protein